MAFEELVDASGPPVGLAKLLSGGAVDGRVGQQEGIAPLLSLEVHHKHLAPGHLVSPVTEGCKDRLVLVLVHATSIVRP